MPCFYFLEVTRICSVSYSSIRLLHTRKVEYVAPPARVRAAITVPHMPVQRIPCSMHVSTVVPYHCARYNVVAVCEYHVPGRSAQLKQYWSAPDATRGNDHINSCSITAQQPWRCRGGITHIAQQILGCTVPAVHPSSQHTIVSCCHANHGERVVVMPGIACKRLALLCAM